MRRLRPFFGLASARAMFITVAAAVLASPVAVASASTPASVRDEDVVTRLRGEWRADVPLPGGLAVQVAVDGTVDAPSLVLTIPKLGVFAQPPRSVSIEDGRIVARIAAVGLVAEVRLAPGPPAAVTIGFPAGPPQVTGLAPATADLIVVPPIRTSPGASRHDAVLVIPGGGRLPITVVLATVDGVEHGLVDIPAQGIQGLALVPAAVEEIAGDEPLAAEPGVRRWVLPVPVPADLVLVPRGDSWQGRFRQGPLALEVAFERAADAAVLASRRPQDPVPPLPYAEIEVEIPTPGGHVLAGTIAMPPAAEGETVPAVVLVTGSGPQNRDEELMGHRPFRVLADRLARAGIASLRYDDRGIAGSTGEFAGATSFDLADDAAAAFAFLRTQPGIDPARSGLAGHSEGGAVVAIVAAGMAPALPSVDPAFIVSIAGCGVSGDRVLADQLARIYRAAGVDEVTIERIRERQARVLAAMRSDELDLDDLKEAMRGLQEAQLELQGGDLDESSREALEAAGISEMTSPWMRTFVRFDPADAFSKVRVPVLALNGTLDLQVWHDLNLPAIEEAVRRGGGTVEAVRFDGLNHLLQPATTGGIDEYGVTDITMDEDAMAAIGRWILGVPPLATRDAGKGR